MEHGKPAYLNTEKCKCALCRQAERDYQSRWVLLRKEIDAGRAPSRDAYMRRYRDAHPELVARERDALALKRLGKKGYVLRAKAIPCMDCGVLYPPHQMHFDHVPERGEKKFNLSQAGSHTMTEIVEEIAKCEVVCANCHAERTYVRGYHGNQRGRPAKGQPLQAGMGRGTPTSPTTKS